MPAIASLLSQPQNLPHIPEIVRELIQSFNQKDPDLLRIADQITKDPVLSAKLLRLANSARYGCSRQIASVRDATVRLGTDTVRNLVLASALIESVDSVPGIDLKHYWSHVFEVAELTKLLDKHQGGRGENAFTCGLMHNIGRLILHKGLPANLVARITDLEPLKGRANAEHAVVGFNYAELGAELAKQWSFPTFISDAILWHYHPLKAEPFSREAGLIHLAIELSTLTELNPDQPAPETWPDKVADKLGITWGECLNLLIAYHEIGNGFDALVAA